MPLDKDSGQKIWRPLEEDSCQNFWPDFPDIRKPAAMQKGQVADCLEEEQKLGREAQ